MSLGDWVQNAQVAVSCTEWLYSALTFDLDSGSASGVTVNLSIPRASHGSDSRGERSFETLAEVIPVNGKSNRQRESAGTAE